MKAIISQQLPFLKFTVAKLFALATICIHAYYSYLHFRVDYPHLFLPNYTESDTYFVVTHFGRLFSIITIGYLLTGIYFFLPQLNQISGTLVFCLLGVGASLMAWPDWFGLHNIHKMSYYPHLQSTYNTFSILSLVFLGVGLVLFVGHIIYDIYIK